MSDELSHFEVGARRVRTFRIAIVAKIGLRRRRKLRRPVNQRWSKSNSRSLEFPARVQSYTGCRLYTSGKVLQGEKPEIYTQPVNTD